MKGEGVHRFGEVKTDQALAPSPAAGVNGVGEVVKTNPPVKGEDDQSGEEVKGPGIPVKVEPVKTSGVKSPADRAVNAFALHPRESTDGPADSAEHARPRLADPGVHPAPAPAPFTSQEGASPQVMAVNEAVKAPGEEVRFTAPEGQSGDMSIHSATTAAPFHPAAGERLPEVKTPTAVPAQAGPVDPSPPMPSPWAVKAGEAVKGEDVHRGLEVKTDQAPAPSPAAGVNGVGEVVKTDSPLNGEGTPVKGEGGELSPEQARKVIEAAWWGGTKTNAETAREAQRSAAYVTKVWKALEKDHGARPARTRRLGRWWRCSAGGRRGRRATARRALAACPAEDQVPTHHLRPVPRPPLGPWDRSTGWSCTPPISAARWRHATRPMAHPARTRAMVSHPCH